MYYRKTFHESYTVMSLKGTPCVTFASLEGAVKSFMEIKVPKRYRFGIMYNEKYYYYDERDNLIKHESYSHWIDSDLVKTVSERISKKEG